MTKALTPEQKIERKMSREVAELDATQVRLNDRHQAAVDNYLTEQAQYWDRLHVDEAMKTKHLHEARKALLEPSNNRSHMLETLATQQEAQLKNQIKNADMMARPRNALKKPWREAREGYVAQLEALGARAPRSR